MDAFFYEVFDEERRALERRMPAGLAWACTDRTIQEHAAEATPPPALVIGMRTQSVIPPAWSGLLRGVLTRSTGYDHILRFIRQTAFAGACGYLPLYCARAVAEHAAMLWLALLRRLPRQQEQFARFHRDGLTGGECLGRTLLVVGVGHIGHEVVAIGRGLGMRVLGVDIVRRHDDVEYVGPDALPQADVIVCAMNLTAENCGYFNHERLGRAKPGAIFVNIARGELSPTADLIGLLDEGVLGGVGLDVYEDEPSLAITLRAGKVGSEKNTPKGDTLPSVAAALELAKRPNVILTPHNAFNTTEAVERKAEQTAEAVVAFLRTGRFPHPIPEN